MESGKFVLRISPQLHRQLKTEAQLKGVSLNDLCNEKLIENPESSSLNKDLDSKMNSYLSDFFGEDLMGAVFIQDKNHSKLLVFLNPEFKINALMQWDFEEKYEALLPAHLKIVFIPNPSINVKELAISPQFAEWKMAALFGRVIFDRMGKTESFLDQVKRILVISNSAITQNSSAPY